MPKAYQGRFRGYRGNKLYQVSHPDYGFCTVAAPDESAAILTSAAVWSTDWTAEEFYANTTVTSAGKLVSGDG